MLIKIHLDKLLFQLVESFKNRMLLAKINQLKIMIKYKKVNFLKFPLIVSKMTKMKMMQKVMITALIKRSLWKQKRKLQSFKSNLMYSRDLQLVEKNICQGNIKHLVCFLKSIIEERITRSF